MSTLKFAEVHNLVAFLSKPTEREGFKQIVDFLNANPIKYALTVNPTVYTSCIEQFWAIVKAKTVNEKVQLQALVDGKKGMIADIDANEDIYLVNVHNDEEDADKDLGSEEVFVAKQDENVVEKEFDAAQLDEEVSLKLQAELQAEFEKEQRLARERAQQKEKANIALIESWDDIQAKINANYHLAKSLQAEEQQELNEEEKGNIIYATLREKAEVLCCKESRRKEEQTTNTSSKEIMCTYLKNMERKKITDLKNKSFDSIRKMFDRAFKRGNPQMDLQDQGVIDSRFSRHMTGNMSYLIDYEEIDGGYVTFGGNPKGGKITGKCTIKLKIINHVRTWEGRKWIRQRRSEASQEEDTSQVNEVHSDDNHIFDNVNHQLAHEMHQEEHLGFDDEYDFLTNTILYEKLSLISDAKNVSTEAFVATSDQIAMIAILNNLTSQVVRHAKTNQEITLENETLKNKLVRCKQKIGRLDTQKIKLILENQVRQEQGLVIQRNQRNAELLKENELLKSTLLAKDKSIEFLKSKKEKDILGTRNPRLGYLAKHTQPVLSDGNTLLDPTHTPISVWDSDDDLVHQVVSMHKMKDKPGHVRLESGFYAKLNAIKFVPQTELSREQAYWLNSQDHTPSKPVTPFVRKGLPPSQVLASLHLVKLKDQLLGKDETIRNLQAQHDIVSLLNVGPTDGRKALETELTQLKDGFKVTNAT
nr:ribonuclease H-like domain-containing protein [Tanacetum cinerariifolium]